ncbi:hypothetical protein UlMin_014845 [Ulmus minor]
MQGSDCLCLGGGNFIIGSSNIVERLNFCAKKTDEWGYRTFGRMKHDITLLQQEIESHKEYSSFAFNVANILRLEHKLEMLLGQDEIYWKQRSRMDWLAHGDRNSKVFHLKASERRRRNKISGLINGANEGCTDPPKLLDFVLDYFQNLFTTAFSALDIDSIL